MIASRQNGCSGRLVKPATVINTRMITPPRANPNTIPRPRSAGLSPALASAAESSAPTSEVAITVTINSRTKPRMVRATGPPGSVSGIQPAATPENVYATHAANSHPSSASTSRISPRNNPISADVTMMNSTP
ncbi:hypothetical protein DP23_4347 [Ralstonia pickettii]|nr:hypothetical protein DP23_4347 [Ralstonia pickettii]